jgi:hypothetical protein
MKAPSVTVPRNHLLQVCDAGSRLSFGLKVTDDHGLPSGLRPLNCERPVRLADDAIGCFHKSPHSPRYGALPTTAAAPPAPWERRR